LTIELTPGSRKPNRFGPVGSYSISPPLRLDLCAHAHCIHLLKTLFILNT
jgi:hypothetical protein